MYKTYPADNWKTGFSNRYVKKCTNCGMVVEEVVKICPNCNNLGFEQTVKLELSQEQLHELTKLLAENLSKKPRFFWSVSWRTLFGLATILGIIALFTGGSIFEFFRNLQTITTANIQAKFELLNRSSSNQITKAYSDITNDVASKFQGFSEDANLKLTSTYVAVTNQIATEFQTSKIKQTVEEVAEGQAREILESNVQPEVIKFQADADLLRLATRARAYDFKAYQQLLDLETQTNENAHFASEVVDEVDRSLDHDRAYDPFFGHRAYEEYYDGHFYQGPFSSDEIATRFPSEEIESDANNRLGFINTASDLDQPLFMSFLFDFFTNETDLSVADKITIAISKISGQDFHPHQYRQIITWWQSNKINFTNWPASDFWHGVQYANNGENKKAATSFERVLEIDPTADMSRSWAIIDNLIIGDTNKAFSLSKDFKFPDGRWAKFAYARKELESGDTSNATVQLAFLSTNYPSFWLFVSPNVDRWQGVDWALFDRLAKQ